MDYKKLYDELRNAAIDYHSAYEGSTLKAEAYETLCKHMDGSRRDNAERAVMAEYDAVQATQDALISETRGM